MIQLSDRKIHTKLKLGALWASVMFCYIYCDYFELYVPGKIEEMIQGKIGPLGDVTQGVLLGTSALMAVPSLMVFLSIALPANYNRILNIFVGGFYTVLLAILIVMAPWYFYKFFAAIETALTALIVWYAWRWPSAENTI